ncbi:kinase-like domain-containing protein [Tuber brumale]|nr:kinase-like domain-containing protein [Tuber brumale]
MGKVQSDLVVRYKLETEFFQDHIRHTRYVEGAKNENEKVMEDWRNCGEIGEGGFGVVHKQIQETTGHYRAVKTIDKRVPSKLDYSRELLVMSILAKCPSLFVEFQGWFEEPEALYIAMEYLPEGDLTKHIDTPLPQETNIFVVRISPVWVKLGDFGISKRILAQDTTTFHTQVSTQVYGAPEVLGLDSNSEMSEYTNSVDIWSLGCVVYELFVGERLFVSEAQVSRYYFGKLPFPEDKLKVLSPPIDDIGISFLKVMLVIQPEDRPTAASALGHPWLVGVNSGNEDGGGYQNLATQRWDKSTRRRTSKSELATYDKLKERRSKRNLITMDDPRYTPRDVGSAENLGSKRGRDPKSPQPAAGAAVMAPPVAASVGPGCTKALRKTEIHDTSETLLQSNSPNTQLNLHLKHVANENWLLDPRPLASDPPTPDLRRRNSFQSTQGTNAPTEHTANHKYPTPVPDKATTRISRRRTYPTERRRFMSNHSAPSEDKVSQSSIPNTHNRGDGRSHDPTINPTQYRNAGPSPIAGQDANA